MMQRSRRAVAAEFIEVWLLSSRLLSSRLLSLSMHRSMVAEFTVAEFIEASKHGSLQGLILNFSNIDKV